MLIVLAASIAPAYNVVPITEVEVTELSPTKVVTVAPRLTLVLPIVTALFARLLFPIEVALVNTVPVSFGSVIVRSAVGSVAVNVVS
jgi:hypothetical protein